MVALLLSRWKILAAVLADVAEMLGSALPTIDWEAQENASLSALLSRGTFIFEGIGKPLQLSLILSFAYLSVSCRAMLLIEGFLAAAAHEDARLYRAWHH